MADLSKDEKAELRKLADRSVGVATVLGFFLPPIAYLYIGKRRLAVFNLLTLNFFLLGFVIVPLHTRSAIKNARQQLRAAGIPGLS